MTYRNNLKLILLEYSSRNIWQIGMLFACLILPALTQLYVSLSVSMFNVTKQAKKKSNDVCSFNRAWKLYDNCYGKEWGYMDFSGWISKHDNKKKDYVDFSLLI